MPEQPAPVAVVIVTWNSKAFLKDCLGSIEALVRPPAELVVVDNASNDGTPDYVRRSFPRAQLVEAETNHGFCRANNHGIRISSSPFILVLNPDTRLEPDYLEQALPAFGDPRVGMVAGKLLRFDGTTLDSCGQLLGRSRRPVDRGYGLADRGQYDEDGEVFGVCGAAALYRREMLQSIADPLDCYFDEAFFAFYEDLDLAWRAQRMGWRAAYRHRAVGRHARGGSARGPSWLRAAAAMLGRDPEVRYHIVKNRYLTIVRNDSLAAVLRNLVFIAARDVAILGLLSVSSPSVLWRCWNSRSLIRSARAKRRLDAARPRHQFSSTGEGAAGVSD
jgi:GT2 family glycosyltransferase